MSGSKKNSNRLLLKPGEKVNEFTVVRLIGQGGYGDVYEVTKDEPEENQEKPKKEKGKKKSKNKQESEEEDEASQNESTHSNEILLVESSLKRRKKLAMKVEMASCQTQSLKLEQGILQALDGSIYFPQIKGFGFKTHFRYLVMDLFGPSLSNTRRKMEGRHFTLSTTLRLGVYMLQCIEEFHKHGYVHCDIKPGNYLLQTDSPCPIVLIDYGLSRKYIDPKTNSPFPEQKDGGYVGTSKYMSLQVHNGCDTCPRDDLISLCYSLVEMIGGKLPWRLEDDTKMKQIIKMKKTLPLEEIFGSLPDQIQIIYKYAMKLKYLDKPDYSLIYYLMNDAIEQNNIKENDPYDWENLDREKVNELSPSVSLPVAKDSVLFPKGVDRNVEIPEGLEQQEGNCCNIF